MVVQKTEVTPSMSCLSISARAMSGMKRGTATSARRSGCSAHVNRRVGDGTPTARTASAATTIEGSSSTATRAADRAPAATINPAARRAGRSAKARAHHRAEVT